MKRIFSIDVTRGMVIVLMALDHTRDLIHTTAITQDPLNLETTTVSLFLTRWITHLCAPIFVFLAGTSAYLLKKKMNDDSATVKFLRTRGLWLILLELTVITLGMWGNIYFSTVLLQVIFAIGAGLFSLSFLFKLPAKTVGLLGVLVMVLLNTIPPFSFANPVLQAVNSLLFSPSTIPFGPNHLLLISYPIIPWLCIMMLGFGFGPVFENPTSEKRKTLFLAGCGAILLFLLIRWLNIWGDPVPWVASENRVKTVLSFINISKYPPSLLYALVMLGIMFLILRVIDGKQNSFTKFFNVFGKVPLFFYICHWYVIRISMYVMLWFQGVKLSDVKLGPLSLGRPETGVGVELPFVYLWWILLIILLYPLCKWYGRYKETNRHKKWLSYL